MTLSRWSRGLSIWLSVGSLKLMSRRLAAGLSNWGAIYGPFTARFESGSKER